MEQQAFVEQQVCRGQQAFTSSNWVNDSKHLGSSKQAFREQEVCKGQQAYREQQAFRGQQVFREDNKHLKELS